MDIAIGWLVAIGAVAIGTGGTIWWGNGNRTVAIWTAAAGFVLWILAGALQAQEYVNQASVASPKPGIDEIAKRQLRANVLVEWVETTNIDDDLMTIGPDKIPSIRLGVRNSGQTPAHNVTHRISARVAAFPPPADLFRVPNLSAGSSEVMASGGRSIYEVGAGPPLNDSQKTLFGLGRLAVYLFGQIDYTDDFGDTRCTKFRYMVGGSIGFNGTAMSAMSDGNEVDTDCDGSTARRRLQDRPRVTIDFAKFEPRPHPDTRTGTYPSEMRFTVDNAGKSPAYEVRAHLNQQWVPEPKALPEDFTFPDYPGTGGSTMTIGAGKTSPPIVFGIDPGKFAEGAAGKLFVFYYGHIDYRDGDGNAYQTNFCFFIRPNPNASGGALIACDRHNDAI